ncbi:PIN domain-containing protein [Bosea sp. (in: a-proteobacteria)]|uniref:PIN domain-containing protein n=1 Tax=Bosea sp. (in: a-proteobacteria) TaxID=1871050 RepID=UPI0027372594|nr:PIN domain-containing protein [Bosea sp. (in: a-proteobacteria)]MDP3407735.1 PIN domain-containing protein [Bosea sp. (in: a-proteobacteria)]
MTAPHEFLDTNVLIYAFSDDPRSARAEALLAKGCASSVQALNEFANVARRKLAMEWREVQEALDAIRALLSAVAPLDLETHLVGIKLAERHRLSVYDAMMIAAALHLRCTTFWSEDLQDGLVVEERLTVRNPFLAGSR